jgi:hypothetical protein
MSMRILLAALALLLTLGPAGAAPKLAGQTVMTYDPGHGTQVEYYDKSGGTWLWYPGNKVILPGRWKLEGANICFAYGENTYNPVTGQSGGGFECMPQKLWAKAVVEQQAGDLFGLENRKKVPFVLAKVHTTLAGIQMSSKPGGGKSDGQSPEGLTPKQQCDQIIANQTRSKQDKVRAALLYYHGMQMGVKCVKVDYIRALTMLREAGEERTIASLLKDLKTKAASGSSKAAAALAKFGS